MRIYTTDKRHYGQMNDEDDGCIISVFNAFHGGYEGCILIGEEEMPLSDIVRRMELYLLKRQLPVYAA